MSPWRGDKDLSALAHLYGVETSYVGADGALHDTDPDVIVPTLRALGVDVSRASDARPALRARRHQLAQRLLEPVITCREHEDAEFLVSVPQAVGADTLWLTVQFEDGTTRHHRVEGSPTEHTIIDVDGQRFRQFRVNLAGAGVSVPLGYHTLCLEVGDSPLSATSLLICAPRCPSPERGWGVFLPLHALRTDHDWGIGSYLDMAALGEWAGMRGASMMGTLPLYPIYLDAPLDPSPYRPVSRLAYNELYVEPEALPEFERSTLARELLSSPEFRSRVQRVRASTTVDYDEVARLRRQVLEPMADALLHGPSIRRDEFELFVGQHPELVAYSQFRATVDRRGIADVMQSPSSGPESSRDDPVVNYFLYGQWVAAQQLREAADALSLYADLPVGVHPEGFDPYWSPTSFVPGLCAGAPPDLFFAEGQNWAFSPLHPQRMRDDHYHHLRAILARAFGHATYVRIDHVMGLQRLYVIPEGSDATRGAYLSYEADELHALVSLEAYRAGASVVGEDLGTVPEGVRERMARDGMLRSWVFEFQSTADDPLPTVSSDVLASLTTHDMPRFSSYLCGHDVDESETLHRLSREEAENARMERARYREELATALDIPVASDSHFVDAIRGKSLAYISASDALLVLVDLEELWGEQEPQNRPGVIDGNWRGRADLTLEQIRTEPRFAAALEAIEHRRRGAA